MYNSQRNTVKKTTFLKTKPWILPLRQNKTSVAATNELLLLSERSTYLFAAN